MRRSMIAMCLLTMLAVPAASFVGGCQGMGGGGGGAADSLTNMLGKIDGEWVLDKLGGKDVASMLGMGGQKPSLSFGNDGSISGFGGVNKLMGSFDPKDLLSGKIDLSKLASTKMAGPPEAMNLESAFTSALSKVTGFNFDKSGGLNLTDGKETLMSFVRGGK